MRFSLLSAGVDGGFEKFASEDAAFHWMVNFAFARRNCTPDEERFLLGRKYTSDRDLHGGNRGNQYTVGLATGEKGLLPDGSRSRNPTRTRIAEEAGVSEHAVRDAVEYADSVDALDSAGVVPKADILGGKVKATQKAVREAAKLAKEGKTEEAKAMLTKTKPKPKEERPTSKPDDDDDVRPLPKAEQRDLRILPILGVASNWRRVHDVLVKSRPWWGADRMSKLTIECASLRAGVPCQPTAPGPPVEREAQAVVLSHRDRASARRLSRAPSSVARVEGGSHEPVS